MPILLSDEDVRSLATMHGAVDTLTNAFRDEATGDVQIGPRANLLLPNGWIRLAAAAMPKQGILGYKEFHRTEGQGVRYSIQLYDNDDGHLLAMLDGNHITALRTGAAAGVALQYLSPQRIETLAVIGSGSEARTQLEAFAAVATARRGLVFSPNRENRQRFCDEMSDLAGFELRPAASAEEAAREADVVLLATKTGSAGPALLGDWLHPGVHVTSIGSTLPTQREIDERSWVVADLIALDTPTLLDESGDAIAAREAGTIDNAKIVQLADIVAGSSPGRAEDDQITLYKSVGTALQDIATARYVYEEARRSGVGIVIDDYQSLK
jgi:alanine dehydrogenase